MDSRPVGVFDSGMGGLTVLHELLVTLPHEDFLYLGDAARLPYGPRRLPEIRRFALEIGGWLEAQGVKLIVVACNAATSAALPDLQSQLAVPVVGVITPEAHAAVQATRNRRIGLLATEARWLRDGTCRCSARWTPASQVFPVACPALVPLIESDDPYGSETVEAVREYAEPLKAAGRRHGHPRLHALSVDPSDSPARLRPRRDARLLGRGDRPRGGRDAGAEGHRERRRRARAAAAF